MKIFTNDPNVSIDTEGGHCETGQDSAHYSWMAHCEGQSLDEAALDMTQEVMSAYADIPHADATEFTYGLIRGLLRKSRKPEGTPANLEGASQ